MVLELFFINITTTEPVSFCSETIYATTLCFVLKLDFIMTHTLTMILVVLPLSYIHIAAGSVRVRPWQSIVRAGVDKIPSILRIWPTCLCTVVWQALNLQILDSLHRIQHPNELCDGIVSLVIMIMSHAVQCPNPVLFPQSPTCPHLFHLFCLSSTPHHIRRHWKT